MDPGEAIRGFLHALGLPPQRIPTGLDAQVASYRSALAGRQVLVVLDNARDAEQVRPLLPGAPGSMAVVTSRDRLTSLVAAEGGTGHRGRRTFGIFRLGPAQRTGQLAVRLPQQLVLRVDLW